MLNSLKEKMTLRDFVFPKWRTSKKSSDKRLKSPVLEDLSKRNMINVPNHCWNLHRSIFIIFIDHCQVKRARKSLPVRFSKCWECFLAHWLPMKSFLFLIETIKRYQFSCNYLRNKKLLLNFLLHFWNLD